jgi:hypothetical protein
MTNKCVTFGFPAPLSEFSWGDIEGKKLTILIGRDSLTSKKVIGGYDKETGNIYVLLETEEEI